MRINQETAVVKSLSGCKNRQGKTVKKEDAEQSKVKSCLDELKTRFAGAEIRIADLDGTSGIRDYASQHYGSFQIVLSTEIVKRMSEDSEFRENMVRMIEDARKQQRDKMYQTAWSGKQVLGGGVYVEADGTISRWIASKDPYQKQMQNKPAYAAAARSSDGSAVSRYQGKDGEKIVIRRKLSYSAARDLSRIARANSQSDVKSAMGGIQARINQFRASGEDKKVIRQLVGQADRVLLKAKLKIRLLKKEALMESAQNRAEAKAELKRAIQLKRMLEESKTKRKGREYGQIRDHYPSPYEKHKWEEEARIATGHTQTEIGGQVYAPAGNSIEIVSGGITSGAMAGVSISINS